MYFMGPGGFFLGQTLANTQADLLSTPQNFDFQPQSPTPDTIYGSLLNGAIFNLCSSDSLIRMAALTFLQGLTRALRIDKIKDVIPFQGELLHSMFLYYIYMMCARSRALWAFL
jgi:hypothetical protein